MAKNLLTFEVGSNRDQWSTALRITRGAPSYVKQGLATAMHQEAEYLRGLMVDGLQSGSPGGKPLKPHSSITRAIRAAQGFGGSKILIRDAGMLGSIKVTRFGQTTFFIGILRGAKGAGGKGRVNLGELHHKGASWRMGVKQRRWLMAQLRKAGALHGRGGSGGAGAGGRITIPARPFIPPVLQKHAKPTMVRDRIQARLERMYRGKLSR